VPVLLGLRKTVTYPTYFVAGACFLAYEAGRQNQVDISRFLVAVPFECLQLILLAGFAAAWVFATRQYAEKFKGWMIHGALILGGAALLAGISTLLSLLFSGVPIYNAESGYAVMPSWKVLITLLTPGNDPVFPLKLITRTLELFFYSVPHMLVAIFCMAIIMRLYERSEQREMAELEQNEP
jgi:hypothetical protein